MHLRDRRGIFFCRKQSRGIHDVRDRRRRQSGREPRELGGRARRLRRTRDVAAGDARDLRHGLDHLLSARALLLRRARRSYGRDVMVAQTAHKTSEH